ncbi:MAG: biopolymer transporter ExbD [Cellvibrionaceae bacterium]
MDTNGQAEDELEVNMTPMLDIVFIMLIFFIVTAVFVKESGVEVLRPEAKTATTIKRVSTLIGITGDNQIWIDNRQVQLDEVRTLVSQLKQENPKGNVVITADAQSDSRVVVEVVQQLNDFDIAGVSIATTKGG